MHPEIIKVLRYVQNVLGYPEEYVLETPTGPIVNIRGREIIMFGSYNYLNLANNNFVKERAKLYIDKYGAGTGGVRLLTGTMAIHKNLESKIAKLTSQDDAMTFSSGYGTNVGVIPGLINLIGFGDKINARKAVIFNDAYNHASIIDGSRLSSAEVVSFKHCDIDDLELKIKNYEGYRKLIITDGIFSMDGDIAPLDKIVRIARKYDAMTMVDEAHSFGVIGESGSGTANYCKIPGQVDINMGTFSKGIGVSGGFISASKELIDYLRVATRSYMFSDSVAPSIIGSVDAALDYINGNPQMLLGIIKKSEYLRNELKKLSLFTFSSNTHIVPICTGSMETTNKVSQELFERGICGPSVRWPAVPKHLGRIRIAVCAGHTYDHLNALLEAMLHISRKYNLPSK